MSIQKQLVAWPYIKPNSQSSAFQYRVRNLSRNHSMKQLAVNQNNKNNHNSKRQVLAKINNKYTVDTSFFLKENINSIQLNSQEDLPKQLIQNNQNITNSKKAFHIQRLIKRNVSHRILRKANSCNFLPQKSSQLLAIPYSLKNSFMKNQERKVSLRKKVEFIKKKHNEDKSQLFEQQIMQFQSENLISQKKKSKPKLKLLVRDPFQSSKAINQRKKAQIFDESRIQSLNNTSMISETNRKQFEEFLSSLN